MIERDEAGAVTITGEHIDLYRVLTVRRGLILKIDTGMSLTVVSCLSIAQRDGITVKRTNRGALKDVNKYLRSHGVDPVWSKTYPTG